MSESKNPHPEFLTDEASGINVSNIKHQAWAEGCKAGREDKRVINTVIKSQNGTVMAFDADGEQIPEYQGQYDDVKESILRDAPTDALFTHWFDDGVRPLVVSREDW